VYLPGERYLRIILDVRQAPSGRLEGSVGTQDASDAKPFEGILELVGLIESYLASSPNGSGVFGVAAEKSGEAPG
jgi:hypothetical protein